MAPSKMSVRLQAGVKNRPNLYGKMYGKNSESVSTEHDLFGSAGKVYGNE